MITDAITDKESGNDEDVRGLTWRYQDYRQFYADCEITPGFEKYARRVIVICLAVLLTGCALVSASLQYDPLGISEALLPIDTVWWRPRYDEAIDGGLAAYRDALQDWVDTNKPIGKEALQNEATRLWLSMRKDSYEDCVSPIVDIDLDEDEVNGLENPRVCVCEAIAYETPCKELGRSYFSVNVYEYKESDRDLSEEYPADPLRTIIYQ